ncbi:hypothetical protein, partial [Halalkalibacter flavus]|uniref:hypothetical protein n=1 Tax=Halalkalibacter flavus TaxID=3090668 RepID=UPI002FCAE183
YKFTWSSQKRGKLGFVAPHSNQKYLAIVEKNTQFYVPFKGKLQFNGPQYFFQAKIQPYSSESSEQQKIFQHSTDVYTTYHNLYDVKPYLEGSNARPVHVASSKQYKKSFGQAYTGYAFQI